MLKKYFTVQSWITVSFAGGITQKLRGDKTQNIHCQNLISNFYWEPFPFHNFTRGVFRTLRNIYVDLLAKTVILVLVSRIKQWTKLLKQHEPNYSTRSQVKCFKDCSSQVLLSTLEYFVPHVILCWKQSDP